MDAAQLLEEYAVLQIAPSKNGKKRPYYGESSGYLTRFRVNSEKTGRLGVAASRVYGSKLSPFFFMGSTKKASLLSEANLNTPYSSNISG